jgi:hypothetical protein
MHKEFKMSIIGELTFFIGLQIKQDKDGIFINQVKYTEELLKIFDLKFVNSSPTLISMMIST